MTLTKKATFPGKENPMPKTEITNDTLDRLYGDIPHPPAVSEFDIATADARTRCIAMLTALGVEMEGKDA